MPGLGIVTVSMVSLAAAISAATRIVGHWKFPDAVSVLPTNTKQDRDSGAGWRFSVIYALTVTLALLISEWGGIARPIWVATTVLLVMQTNARTSYERIAQRIFGTVVGVLAAFIVISVLHSLWLLMATILLVAFLVPHGTSRNYWVHSALTALLILVLYDFAALGHAFDLQLLWERIRDVVLGCALAFIGTLLAFAASASDDAKSKQHRS
jgi:uncharacterized membrane protein YccC